MNDLEARWHPRFRAMQPLGLEWLHLTLLSMVGTASKGRHPVGFGSIAHLGCLMANRSMLSGGGGVFPYWRNGPKGS